MEVSDSELRNEMFRTIKLCYHFCKTDPEIVKLIQEACEDKCFGQFTIFRCSMVILKKDFCLQNRLLSLAEPKVL